MLQQFQKNIQDKILFTQKNKLLLAFSGGVDSVALTHLLLKSGYRIELAHCNFNLRGKESDADEKFCVAFAKKMKLKIHVKQFDTKSYVKIKKLSVQMAARELRYHWFQELVQKYHFDYILTAHHSNDNIETLLVNLTRGTGLKGLLGIPEKQENIIRPLLFTSKKEILQYAEANKLQFRHDSSNDEVKYARNLIRHKVIPALHKLNPSLENTFSQNIQLFKEANDIIENYITEKSNVILNTDGKTYKIDIDKLLQSTSPSLLLHEWLSPLGFNTSQTQQLLKSLHHQTSGKTFVSETHSLLIDRDFILVKPKKEENHLIEYEIKKLSDFSKLPVKIKVETDGQFELSKDSKSAFINYHKIKFPLILRKWKNGDRFMPLGMKGFKKLSDFFISNKISRFEKENTYVLCNGNEEIMWVIGKRLDERYKITGSTSKILKLSLK